MSKRQATEIVLQHCYGANYKMWMDAGVGQTLERGWTALLGLCDAHNRKDEAWSRADLLEAMSVLELVQMENEVTA